ncbi:hypothetical protein TrST_g7219 [Triparma strigata]|uniref:RAP domain-containing protein n=1 Tax=Triparma strigata TaxID=1606541 RepID=A0A9W6ZSL0_9STRA|nr:hypothetical protein TrST_g7219 [Triparma strigata]
MNGKITSIEKDRPNAVLGYVLKNKDKCNGINLAHALTISLNSPRPPPASHLSKVTSLLPSIPLKPRQTAIVYHALSKLHGGAPEFKNVLLEHLLPRLTPEFLDKLNPQELVMLVSSFSNAFPSNHNLSPPSPLPVLTPVHDFFSRIPPLLPPSTLNPRTISTLLHSFSTINHPLTPPSTTSFISSLITNLTHSPTSNPHDLTLSLHSSTNMCDRSKSLNPPTTSLFQKITSLTPSTYSLLDVNQLIASYGIGRFDDFKFLQDLYKIANENIRNENVEVIGNGLWTAARLYVGLECDDLEYIQEYVETGVEVLRGRVDEVLEDEQVCANFVWSVTVLERRDEGTKEIVRRIFKELEDKEVKKAHLHQLYQAYCLCDCGVEVSPAFEKRMEKEWRREKERAKKSSNRHMELSKVLKLMRIAHTNEYEDDIDVSILLTPSGGDSGSVGFTKSLIKPLTGVSRPPPGRKIALEFDGPDHFTRTTQRSLGHTVLKYRLLTSLGYAVVRVPYYVWDRIPFWASMERQRYLQRLLKTEEVVRFSEVDRSEYTPLGKSKSGRAEQSSRFD